MKTALVGCIAAALATTGADAGFAGFVAFSRNVEQSTVIDVFAAATGAGDKFINVFDAISDGAFVHKAGQVTKTWKPDAAGFSNTRSTINDSFMTAGTFSGGVYGGEYYASTNTKGDPNFSGTSWNATPASPAATSIPSNAGWYTGDPTSVDNNPESLAVWGGGYARTNSQLVAVVGGDAAPLDSSQAVFGVWVAHLVVSGNDQVIGRDFTFTASATVLGDSSSAWQATYTFVPSPSALALLSLSGLAARRRRS